MFIKISFLSLLESSNHWLFTWNNFKACLLHLMIVVMWLIVSVDNGYCFNAVIVFPARFHIAYVHLHVELVVFWNVFEPFIQIDSLHVMPNQSTTVLIKFFFSLHRKKLGIFYFNFGPFCLKFGFYLDDYFSLLGSPIDITETTMVKINIIWREFPVDFDVSDSIQDMKPANSN